MWKDAIKNTTVKKNRWFTESLWLKPEIERERVVLFKYPDRLSGRGKAVTTNTLCDGHFCGTKKVLFNPYAAGGLFGQYKMLQKTWKITETLANGYSSESTRQKLSNEYQYDRV